MTSSLCRPRRNGSVCTFWAVVFSGVLIPIEDRFTAGSMTIALCAADDAVLRPIAERFRIAVVVDDVVAASRRDR